MSGEIPGPDETELKAQETGTEAELGEVPAEIAKVKEEALKLASLMDQIDETTAGKSLDAGAQEGWRQRLRSIRQTLEETNQSLSNGIEGLKHRAE